jgi:ubiquinol-cytochrome c reductase cytochrome b subunit
MLQRSSTKKIIFNHLVAYPTPKTITFAWGIGSLTGLFVVLQIISGFLAAIYYTPHIQFAFSSVDHLMRDVNFG